MLRKNLVTYIALIVLLKPTLQYDENAESSKDTENNESSVLYEYKNFTVNKGSDVVLICSSQHGNNATWLHIRPDVEGLITTTSNGISELSIRNITYDNTYDCQSSNNTVRRFLLSVKGPKATISKRSSEIVQNGTTVQFLCVINSTLPVETAYLRFQNFHKTTSDKCIARWESRKRICSDANFIRTDCTEETTFEYNLKAEYNGVYFCGYEDVESFGVHVEVINSEPIIHHATGSCSSTYVQKEIIKIALEALKKFGLNKDTATDIRESLNGHFSNAHGPISLWNCIIGRIEVEHSLSSDIVDELKFSFGSTFVDVFRTKN